MKTAYPIILTPAETGYVVTVPDLQINTEGADIADAIDMAADAIGLWGITAQDMGKVVPAPFEEGGEFVVEIIGDAGMGTGGLKAGALYGCEPSEAFLYRKVFHGA